jgi:hypothetical protein
MPSTAPGGEVIEIRAVRVLAIAPEGGTMIIINAIETKKPTAIFFKNFITLPPLRYTNL